MSEIFTRRNVLIGSTACAVTAMGGLSWAATSDFKSAVLAFYKRALPGVTIDEKSALLGIDEFTSDWPTAKRLVLQTAWNTARVETLAGMSPRFESAARHILTHFLLNSNFFQVKDPRAQPIVYVSRTPRSACGNPFANLEPPEGA